MANDRDNGGFAADIFSDSNGKYRRLRVDPAQTSFFASREYRTYLEFSVTSGQTLAVKIVTTTDIILHDLALNVDGGGIRMRTRSGGTPGGSYSTNQPVIRKNSMATAPNNASGATITSGGSVSGGHGAGRCPRGQRWRPERQEYGRRQCVR